MGFLLVIAGGAMNYFGWKSLLSVQDKKVNRHFRAWWTRGETEGDSEGLRVVNGTLFIISLIGVGLILVVAGVASFFV